MVTLFMGKPPGGIYQYLDPILSPVTDKMLFFNSRRGEIFSTKDGLLGVDHGTPVYEANTLPTELQHLVPDNVSKVFLKSKGPMFRLVTFRAHSTFVPNDVQ